MEDVRTSSVYVNVSVCMYVCLSVFLSRISVPLHSVAFSLHTLKKCLQKPSIRTSTSSIVYAVEWIPELILLYTCLRNKPYSKSNKRLLDCHTFSDPIWASALILCWTRVNNSNTPLYIKHLRAPSYTQNMLLNTYSLIIYRKDY